MKTHKKVKVGFDKAGYLVIKIVSWWRCMFKRLICTVVFECGVLIVRVEEEASMSHLKSLFDRVMIQMFMSRCDNEYVTSAIRFEKNHEIQSKDNAS